MKTSTSIILASALAMASSSAAMSMKRATTKSFAGGNNYYIHTTNADVQDRWVQQLKDDGAKVARLWVTGGGGCQKGSSTNSMSDIEPSLGHYVDDSLKALDKMLKKLSDAGIKAIISPHNANNLKPNTDACNQDVYCSKWGANGFYTSADAKAAYDRRLAHILNFNSPSFGKKWSQLSEAIMAFDVQNEPFIMASDLVKGNDQSDWLCGRAGNMAKLTKGSGVKVATGGIAGSQYDGHAYNLMDRAVACDAVDIVSMHSYLTKNQWSEFIPSALSKVKAKHLMIEEFGVGNTQPGANVAPHEFSGIVDLFNNAGIPWVYWQITPAPDETQSGCKGSCCGKSLDGFEYGPGSTKGGITMKQAIGKANSVQAKQDWTGFVR